MKKAEKKDSIPQAPPRAKGAPAEPAQPEEHQHKGSKLHLPNLAKIGNSCKANCYVISFNVLCVVAILISLIAIVITGVAAVATKVYDTEQSSRLVALIVLCVSAAVSLSVCIYLAVSACKKSAKIKSLYITGILLLILAVIQALISGISINVTEKDEALMIKSITNSFKAYREENSRHVALWSATQSDLKCCGLNSPDDFRESNMPFYFPPNVPIPCCTNYNSSKPLYIQERERELCRTNNLYYRVGCKGLLLEVLENTAASIIGITVALIVLEVVLTIIVLRFASKKKKQQNKDLEGSQQTTENELQVIKK